MSPPTRRSAQPDARRTRDLGIRGNLQQRIELLPDPGAPSTGRATPASTTGRTTPASSHGGHRTPSSNDSGGSVHGTTGFRSPRPGAADQEISSARHMPSRGLARANTPMSTLEVDLAASIEAQKQRFGTSYVAPGCRGSGHVLERTLQCVEQRCACKKSCGDLRCQVCGPTIRAAWSEEECLAELERMGLQIRWAERKTGRERTRSRDISRDGRRRDGLGIPRTRRGYFGLDSVHLHEDPAARQCFPSSTRCSSADSTQLSIRRPSATGSALSAEELPFERLSLSEPTRRP